MNLQCMGHIFIAHLEPMQALKHPSLFAGGQGGGTSRGKDILEALWTMYFLKKSVCGSPGYADLWSMCHVPCLGFQILHLLFCAGCTWGRGTWETCKGRGRRGKAQKTARFYESSGPKTAPQSSMEQDEGGKFRLFCCPPSGTRIPREVKWENVRVRWMWDVKWMDVEDVMNGRQGRDGRGRRGGRGTWRTWRTWGRDALQVILHFFSKDLNLHLPLLAGASSIHMYLEPIWPSNINQSMNGWFWRFWSPSLP